MKKEFFISCESFNYVRMSILNWVSGQLSNPTTVTASPGKKIVEIARQSKLPLVINMKGITSIDEYALSKLRENIDISVIFLCDDTHPKVKSSLERELKANESNLSFNDDMNALFFHSDLGLVSSLDTNKIEKKYITNIISQSYEPFSEPKRLSSTPITTTGEFNARKIIQDFAAFAWVSIFLADQVEHIIKSEKPEAYSLMAVSLRGSPFAFAVWHLLQAYSPRIEIVDHLGPIHELFEDPDIDENQEYKTSCIFVGDFVIGGSELKVARSHAIFHGKQLEHAVCIGSALEPEAYGGGKVKLNSIVKLPECNPFVSYDFK